MTEAQARHWLERDPAYQSERAARFQELQRSGFATKQARNFAVGQKPSWWQRLWTVQAYDYYPSGGWVSITEMDDGDPNTYEYFVEGIDEDGIHVTGVQQFYMWDPEHPWSFGETFYAPGNLAERRGPIGTMGELLSPGLHAWELCDGGMPAARHILIRAFGAGAVTTGGALFWCSGAAIGYGGCLAGNFFGTFVVALVWETYLWRSGC